jgi:endo-1,4-beta-D-glucanase Y
VTEWIADCGGGLLRVEWDTQSQTVSEGIGYGMLLAASWEDQATFDGLFAFYQSHLNANGLMNWKVDCNGTVDGGAFGLHTGDTAYWDAAANDTYYYLDANNNDTTGLISDWMDPDTLQCSAKGWGDWHGWDASRVPWRVVTDFIWWGNAEAEAYSITIADFVISKGGVAQTCQGYNLDGTQCGATPAVTTFAGAFASSGIAKDQDTVNDFFDDLKTVENNGYFNEILNALYFTTAVQRFKPGCY